MRVSWFFAPIPLESFRGPRCLRGKNVRASHYDLMLAADAPPGPTLSTPKLRGRIHQVAVPAAIVGLVVIVTSAATPLARAAAWIYGISMVALYAVSSSYHVMARSGLARSILRRLDHAMIYVLIAGTYTPLCLLALPQPLGLRICGAIWAAAFVGVYLRIATPSRWSWLAHTWYFVLGVAILPWIGELNLTGMAMTVIAMAGATYAIAAILFFCHIPHKTASWFGYHELWHTLGVIAGIVLFVVNYQIIAGS